MLLRVIAADVSIGAGATSPSAARSAATGSSFDSAMAMDVEEAGAHLQQLLVAEPALDLSRAATALTVSAGDTMADPAHEHAKVTRV